MSHTLIMHRFEGKVNPTASPTVKHGSSPSTGGRLDMTLGASLTRTDASQTVCVSTPTFHSIGPATRPRIRAQIPGIVA